MAKNGNTLGFRAKVGPIAQSQVDPRTQRLATVSLPFDFRKDVIDQFSFNGNRYFLNNSSTATSYSTGANVNFTSIPTPFAIRSLPNGPIIGYTGVADTKAPTTSGKLTGSFGSVTVNVLSSTHYKSMVFYNHFGTDNIELQFGSFRVGERATIEGEIIVSQNQSPNTWTFQAESLSHQIGRRDADGWSVRNGDTPGQFMTYGPYTTSISVGNRTATFRLMLDNVSADNNRILTIDVLDAGTGRVVASRSLTRRQFSKAMSYQDFDLNFTATAGQRLEFRTLWHGGSYVRQDFVRVK